MLRILPDTFCTQYKEAKCLSLSPVVTAAYQLCSLFTVPPNLSLARSSVPAIHQSCIITGQGPVLGVTVCLTKETNIEEEGRDRKRNVEWKMNWPFRLFYGYKPLFICVVIVFKQYSTWNIIDCNGIRLQVLLRRG